jgi:uncharacterized protein YbjT (DUF2867 family)
MASGDGRTVVLTGATGRLKGATARRLLGDGWRVRALTGTPASRKARAPGALGAEVVRGDVDDPASLLSAFRAAGACSASSGRWRSWS